MSGGCDTPALVESFLAFEGSRDVFSLRVKGRPFWEYIRYQVCNGIINAKSDFVFPRKRRYGQYLGKMAAFFVFLLKFFLMRSRYDVILVNYDRLNSLGGKDLNIHMHPLARILGAKWRVLLVDPYDLIVRPKDYPCEVLCCRPLLLICRLCSFFVRFSREDRKVFASLSADLRTYFGVEVDISGIARRVFAFHFCYYRAWRVILRKFRPAAVAFCDNGGMKGLIEAAHDLRIQTVDFQHSLVSGLNILYHYPETIKDADIRATVPDHVFAYGEYWKKEFRLPAQVVTAGFPYFEITAAAAVAKAQREGLAGQEALIIISDFASRQRLAQLAIELSRLVPGLLIYFKLRIEEYAVWKERYPRELSQTPSIRVIDDNRTSLYEYFARCRFQVGTNSGAIYEGLPFGLTTFILKAGWYPEMKRLYEQGHAFLVEDARQIAGYISKGQSPARQLAADAIFRQGSEGIISREMARVINAGSTAQLAQGKAA